VVLRFRFFLPREAATAAFLSSEERQAWVQVLAEGQHQPETAASHTGHSSPPDSPSAALLHDTPRRRDLESVSRSGGAERSRSSSPVRHRSVPVAQPPPPKDLAACDNTTRVDSLLQPGGAQPSLVRGLTPSSSSSLVHRLGSAGAAGAVPPLHGETSDLQPLAEASALLPGGMSGSHGDHHHVVPAGPSGVEGGQEDQWDMLLDVASNPVVLWAGGWRILHDIAGYSVGACQPSVLATPGMMYSSLLLVWRRMHPQHFF